MNPVIKVVLILGVLSVEAIAQHGLDFTWSHAWGDVSKPNIGFYNISYFRPNPKLPGFLEFGFTGMPEMSADLNRINKTHVSSTFMGIFGGHTFLTFGGYVRPGFHLGSLWELETQYDLTDGVATEKVNSKTAFRPYFAFKLQILIGTFILSNRGIGGGFNLSL